MQTKLAHTPSPRATDSGNTCALCSTRSCHSCASEDTGYSSDTDALPTQVKGRRSEQSVLDLSHDSLFKVSDLDDKDDGVSVDLSEFDKSEQTPTVFHHSFDDDDLITGLEHQCHVGKSGPSIRRRHSCVRTASLCERHSNKLCVPDTSFSNSDLGNKCRTCKCGGQTFPMSSSKSKVEDGKKEVILHLRSTEPVWDTRFKISWLEAVLGIVPGCDDDHRTLNQGDADSDKIVIRGLAPDGPAVRSKKLCIGDSIESINGKQVTWSNLSIVLSSLHHTRKVRLVVKRPCSQQTSTLSDRLLLDTGSVLKALQDHHNSPTPTRQRRRGGDRLEAVCVLYMSVQGGGADREDARGEKRDVVYQFPQEEGVLSRLRGSFFTLDHLLSDGCEDSDVRTLTVGVEGSLVHVTCHKEGKDMLIIAAPANRLQASQLLTVSNRIVRLVRVLYGSVEEAFSSERHHRSLDDFLAFTFTTLYCGTSIGNTLTEYESADFAEMSDSFYGCRRSFTVLGSMAFYKGQVTCCHLSAKDAGDVGVYLRHSGLLDLSVRHNLHQVLVWREVFPSRLCHEVSALNSVFGYSEPHARWFLMVVGVKNTLLACVLEAGGCSTQLEGICLPDPFYVDQARAALLHLQTPDIISACESRLNGDGLPTITTADKLLSQLSSSLQSNNRVLDNFLKTSSSLTSSLHNTQVLPALSNTCVVPGGGLGPKGALRDRRKLSIESDGSSGSGSSNEGMFKNKMKRGRLFPVSTHSNLSHNPTVFVDSDINTYKLSSGKENNLLVFCQINEQEGVLNTSPEGKTSASETTSLHRQVVDNFYRCVTQMHSDFALATNAKIYPSEGVLEDVQGDQNWRSCREEGVMFTCSPAHNTDGKRSPHTLLYWVVGRKFKNLHCREVYVCFQDSTPQHVIELAFRLSLGSLSSA